MKMHRLFPALWALIILACLFGVQGQRNVVGENQQVIGHDGQQQVPSNLDSNVIGVAHVAQRSGVNNTVPSTLIAPEGNISRQNSMATPSKSLGGKNIVDTAIATGNLKTLVTALQTTGLVNTLNGKGPFTVFAPTDAAFAKIPKDQLIALMANKTELTNLLNYHVVLGEVMSTDFKNGLVVRTVQGENLTFTLANGGVMIENARVVQADIVCANGVIHVIDVVLIPRLVAMNSSLNSSRSNIYRNRNNSTNSTNV